MTMTDPLGDMLTRIRNAQMRGKSKVSTPGLARCASACSTCCRPKATSAATPPLRMRPAASEFEIELKYFDGEPVIREIERVSKPGRRVYASVRDLAARQERPRHLDPVDAEGRDVGCTRPATQNVGGEVLCTVF